VHFFHTNGSASEHLTKFIFVAQTDRRSWQLLTASTPGHPQQNSRHEIFGDRSDLS
jgi:hypothetical protein